MSEPMWSRPVSLRAIAWTAVAALLAANLVVARDELAPALLVVGGAGVAAALLMALWPRPGRASGESSTTDGGELARHVDELDAHAAETAALAERVADLENRLEFAERLLGERRLPEVSHHPTPV